MIKTLFALLIIGVLSIPQLSLAASNEELIDKVTEIGGGNYDKGLEHLISESKGGNSTATFLISQLLFAAQKEESAINFLGLAAEQGHPVAIKTVGKAYMEGTFSQVSYSQARFWFLKGAKLRNINSMMYLGIMNRDGLGGDIDNVKAYFWFSLAGRLKPDTPNVKEPEDFAKEIEHHLSSDQMNETKLKVAKWIEENPEVVPEGISPLD